MPFMEQVNEGSGVGYVNFSLDNGWIASDGNEGQMTLQVQSAPILIDVVNITQGWLQLAPGIRDWQPFVGQPHSQPSPEHKVGFSALFYSKKHFGEDDPYREMTTNQFASKQFLKDVYNEAEKMWDQKTPFAESGMSALVMIDPKTTALKVGGGRSVKISFTIQKLMPMPQKGEAPAPQPVAAPPVSAPQAATAPTPPPATNDIDFSNISADEI
jgi:hypothetical protein